jgi:hypothetical protein
MQFDAALDGAVARKRHGAAVGEADLQPVGTTLAGPSLKHDGGRPVHIVKR